MCVCVCVLVLPGARGPVTVGVLQGQEEPKHGIAGVPMACVPPRHPRFDHELSPLLVPSAARYA